MMGVTLNLVLHGRQIEKKSQLLCYKFLPPHPKGKILDDRVLRRFSHGRFFPSKTEVPYIFFSGAFWAELSSTFCF